MKKVFVLLAIVFFALNSVMVFAQDYDEDYDPPYLSDEDILALEAVFQDDEPPAFQGSEAEPVEAAPNEMPRLNTSQPVYHLLVLDRRYCPNADITDLNGIRVLYKFLHGRSGYLIAVYVSPQDGPVFPQLPDGSRIIVNMSSIRRATLREYVNSNAFRRHVSGRRIIAGLLRVL